MNWYCIKITTVQGIIGYVSLVGGRFSPGIITNRACVVWSNSIRVIAKILPKIRKRWQNIRSIKVLTFDRPLY